MRKIVKFFDKAEDKIRGTLAHYPITYGFLGGVGVVLFWRGVWHIADELRLGSLESLILGSLILLFIGVFVSTFIGNKIIISGLMGGKKLSEKEISEIQLEEAEFKNMQNTLDRIEKKISELEEKIKSRSV